MLLVQYQRHMRRISLIVNSSQKRNNGYVNNTQAIFNFRVDCGRKHAIMQQIHMHGGLNHLLKQYGHCPLESCKQAIEKAFGLGLIGNCTYKKCIAINQKANKAKHVWEQDEYS